MRGSRNFRQGRSRSVWQRFFFFFFFFFKSSADFTEVKWSISKKSIIFQGSRGGLTFCRGGGSNFFQGGGSNCLFPIKPHITCGFPGGSGPPVPPLDPHLHCTHCIWTYYTFKTACIHVWLILFRACPILRICVNVELTRIILWPNCIHNGLLQTLWCIQEP